MTRIIKKHSVYPEVYRRALSTLYSLAYLQSNESYEHFKPTYQKYNPEKGFSVNTARLYLEELIDKQYPMEVEISVSLKDSDKDPVYRCGKCYAEIDIRYAEIDLERLPKYCSNCGQALMWDDIKEELNNE